MTNEQTPQRPDEQQPQRFITDTQRLVQQHLNDPDHEITEEDIRNVRVGMTPPLPEDRANAFEDTEDRVTDRNAHQDEKNPPGEQQITPWNLIEPGA
jgi:hypothetical protein